MLLIHGFGDTPQTLRLLAEYLHAHGYDVRVPLLPGHGRGISDFDRASHSEWIDAARAELCAMRARYGWSAVGGLSMGGAIATILAAELPDLPALVLMAPYLGMPWHIRMGAALAPLWSRITGPLRAAAPESIRDPGERDRSLSYGFVTGNSLRELWLTVRMAREALGKVRAPTLIIQSEDDNRIPPRVARYAYAAIGAVRKRLIFTRGAGHIITVDYGRDQVFAAVLAWLDAARDERSAS